MGKLTFKNLYKIYDGDDGKFTAVDNFNLEVEDKEFIVLVGPSGCGKSTTLRMVAGLEDISKGELYIDDRLVNDVAPKDRDIAMVFQNYALYPHMTVYENIGYGLRLRKTEKDEMDKKIRDAAKSLGIENLLDRKPKALSGGQRQRVALGRAIVRNPKVFLMDEPLSNLDAKLRVQMRMEISRLHRQLETTFLYVTHDQTEAMTMADRIVVMKSGIVHQVDSPQVLYDNPVDMFVAGFIGSPQMNFIKASVRGSKEECYLEFGENKILVPLAKAEVLEDKGYISKDIILGIRPEDIHDEFMFLEASEDNRVQALVNEVEIRGSEIYLFLEVAGNEIIARVDPRNKSKRGDKLELGFDTNKLHFFDIDTEKSILF